MSQSPIIYTNKPQKPHPLDDRVWRQKFLLNKEENIPNEIKSEPQYLLNRQLEDSQTINNYSVRSALILDESDYIQVDWQAFKLISFV